MHCISAAHTRFCTTYYRLDKLILLTISSGIFLGNKFTPSFANNFSALLLRFLHLVPPDVDDSRLSNSEFPHAQRDHVFYDRYHHSCLLVELIHTEGTAERTSNHIQQSSLEVLASSCSLQLAIFPRSVQKILTEGFLLATARDSSPLSHKHPSPTFPK